MTRWCLMLDRDKIEAVLSRRFPGATLHQIAAAANGIMGLGDEWEEIRDRNQALAGPSPGDWRDIGSLARESDREAEFRLFRRRAI